MSGSTGGVCVRATPWRRMVAVFLGILVGGSVARAANPTPVQLFYIPFPEDQLLQGLQAIQATGSGFVPVNPVTTLVSIAAVADGTIVYYDQWENGYDADIANPANLFSGGNPGGTQIWGDGNPANGAPPGVPSDLINSGTVIVLNNPVTTTDLSAIDFDGRDKIAATKAVAITRTGFATGPNTLLAGAVEVFDTGSWGSDYRAPVGANILDSTDFQMFEYTSLAIMAGEGGATVQIDKDADGVFEDTQVLSEGQGFFVNGGVDVGGRIVSDRSVQVTILTGDIASSYESRDSALLPTSLWSTSYYTPVSTAASAQSINGTATSVWLYNPGVGPLTVKYTTRDGVGDLTEVDLSVPGGPSGGYLKQVIPDGYGARFTAATPFYAFSTTNSTDSASSGGQYTGNQAWDWGFTLIPGSSLTSQVLIGLGIGRDPTSSASPTQNGNPVWVTPVGNADTPVTVYVDFDADPTTGPLTDPNGNKYDVALTLRELDRAKVYDTTDGNQTGMLLYTLASGVKLAAAWGQDPSVASAGAPGLDVGTGIPPLPEFSVGKNGTLDTDNDGDGFVSPGDVLLYTIVVSNISRVPVSDVLVQDTLPPDTTYVPNSTFFTNASAVTTQIPDDASGTAFPLDGSGVVLDPVTALPVGGSYTVTFKVVIDSFTNLTPGTTEILNVCSASAAGVILFCTDTTPLFGKIGDFVWADLDGDTVQDGGAEVGIGGVDVQLILDANGNGVFDAGDSVIATQTTDGSGGYLFTGLPAGSYIVNVVDATVPPTYALTTANDPTAVSLAGGESRLDLDFGYQPPPPPTTTSTTTTTTTSTTTSTTSSTTSTTSTTTSTTTTSTTTTTCPPVTFPPPGGQPSTNLNDYVLFATSRIQTKGFTVANGHVGVNSPGGRLIAPRFFDAPNSVVASDRVRFDEGPNRIRIGRLFANVIERVAPPATYLATPILADPSAACGFPTPFPPCNESNRVNVVPGATTVLPPGVYGDVRVAGGAGTGAMLVLTGGDYVFCDVKLGHYASVRALAPVRVSAAGRGRFGPSSYFGTDVSSEIFAGLKVSDFKVYFTESMKFGRDAKSRAYICAPDADIRMSKGGTHVGVRVASFIFTEEVDLDLGECPGVP